MFIQLFNFFNKYFFLKICRKSASHHSRRQMKARASSFRDVSFCRRAFIIESKIHENDNFSKICNRSLRSLENLLQKSTASYET